MVLPIPNVKHAMQDSRDCIYCSAYVSTRVIQIAVNVTEKYPEKGKDEVTMTTTEESDAPPDKSKEEETAAGTKRSNPDESKEIEDAISGDVNEFELDPEKRREVRKMRRVMANRRSARESRERRKKLLTDLQDSVESLTSENANLTKENLSLRRELAMLIEQSGGAGALGMIPNIQALLQSTQGLAGLLMPATTTLQPSFTSGEKK